VLPPDRAYQSSLKLAFDRTEVLWTAGHLAGPALGMPVAGVTGVSLPACRIPDMRI
jgi:hypothetical protein